jgi:hypothetical protein
MESLFIGSTFLTISQRVILFFVTLLTLFVILLVTAKFIWRRTTNVSLAK